MKEIEIIIPADGSEPSIDLKGYDGVDCLNDAKELIKELGAKEVSSKKKAEYFRNKCKNEVKTKK